MCWCRSIRGWVWWSCCLKRIWSVCYKNELRSIKFITQQIISHWLKGMISPSLLIIGSSIPTRFHLILHPRLSTTHFHYRSAHTHHPQLLYTSLLSIPKSFILSSCKFIPSLKFVMWTLSLLCKMMSNAILLRWTISLCLMNNDWESEKNFRECSSHTKIVICSFSGFLCLDKKS